MGSSPRVRGKLGEVSVPSADVGLIPACAGKTTKLSPSHRVYQAHPRVCGENKCRDVETYPVRGSSPRVRGKLIVNVTPATGSGLIPACAGKTHFRRNLPYSSGAHPRVCGENALPDYCRLFKAGSSPRVRGKPAAASRCFARLGLIPACAGKTRRFVPWSLLVWAHPRVCGENQNASWNALDHMGSSPRVRGKHDFVRFMARRSGLIPACAGKTGVGLPRNGVEWAHPRVCGENQGGGGAAAPLRAHPRVCGENVHFCLPPFWGLGSSPRVRGKLCGFGR